MLSRELTIDELKEIRSKVKNRTGGLCSRLYLHFIFRKMLYKQFSYIKERKQGRMYEFMQVELYPYGRKRPGEHFPVFEDDRGTYIMSSKDLCMIEHLHLLIDAGIDSFKIEGRMRA